MLRAGTTAAVGAFGIPRADVEVAIQFQAPVDPGGGADAVRAAAGRFGVALELCDLGGGDDAPTIVASNVFHRAVAFVEAGDVVITGSIVQVPIRAGQAVVAELDDHGAVGLTLAP
ncbi:hypothetical protein [Jiangella rhizosphaerae]|uniref:Uncharacterized protein n=1 Tax=Jiangella rhizosphaerae TaxID=2293569 RepID=A0A418KTA1_9ACTN|nr:hypothetical protein [Jiangella rhizosphaerae]RIQ29630.1 hypothetical protein DY240_08000 [Jiangella rhizosphaerae]